MLKGKPSETLPSTPKKKREYLLFFYLLNVLRYLVPLPGIFDNFARESVYQSYLIHVVCPFIQVRKCHATQMTGLVRKAQIVYEYIQSSTGNQIVKAKSLFQTLEAKLI